MKNLQLDIVKYVLYSKFYAHAILIENNCFFQRLYMNQFNRKRSAKRKHCPKCKQYKLIVGVVCPGRKRKRRVMEVGGGDGSLLK